MKVKISPIVSYEWSVKHYTGQQIAIDKRKNYLAYALKGLFLIMFSSRIYLNAQVFFTVKSSYLSAYSEPNNISRTADHENMPNIKAVIVQSIMIDSGDAFTIISVNSRLAS